MSPKKLANHLLTGRDGESHDIGRWSWLCSSLAVTGAAAANWFHGQPIDLMSFGGALSAVAAAHGAALGLKRQTEPEYGYYSQRNFDRYSHREDDPRL